MLNNRDLNIDNISRNCFFFPCSSKPIIHLFYIHARIGVRLVLRLIERGLYLNFSLKKILVNLTVIVRVVKIHLLELRWVELRITAE